MKYKMIVLLLAILVSWGVASNTQAEIDPYLIPDTLAIQVTVDTTTVPATVVVEVYAFSDSLLAGASAGFSWLNSSVDLTLDTAYASQLLTDGFGIGPFFYEDNSKATSNANKRFLIGGAQLFTPGIPGDASGRRLWATYEFSFTTWTDGDSIVVDTMQFNAGSGYAFSIQGVVGAVEPVWEGRYVFQFPTDVKDVTDGNLPQTFSLQQNYPNPFNPTTRISFDVPRKSNITLTVYNILGQKVTTLVDREMAPGSYEVDWDGKTDGGTEVASGVYFYKIKADSFVETKKMMLVR